MRKNSRRSVATVYCLLIIRRSLMWKIAALLYLALLLSCTPGANKVPASLQPEPGPASGNSQVETKAPWEEEWQTIVARARKEGKVVIYSSTGSETRAGLVSAFHDKYGLSVDYITGKGIDVIEKLMAERKAGIYTGDLYIGGNTPMLEMLKPAGALALIEQDLLLPEVKDGKNWLDGSLYFVDKERYILQFAAYPMPIFGINTQLLKQEDVASYKDLLSPKMKGKIIMNDPTRSGLGSKWFQAEYRRSGLDFMRALAKQEPVIITDQRIQLEWLAHGKYPLLIGPKSDTFAEFYKAGAPIRVIDPKEGGILTSGSGNVSLLSKPAHPYAAKLFVNWLLSKEGQIAFEKATLVHSGRVDVPTDFLPEGKARDSKIKYFNVEVEEILRNSVEDYKLARDVFGHLMK